MICHRCQVVKLSDEFPPFTLTEACRHPPLHCLRCVIQHWEENQQCSLCDQKVIQDSIQLQKCYKILENLFPEILGDDVNNDDSTPQDLTIMKLNGEAIQIDYVPSLSISQIKKTITGRMKIPSEKQRLVFNGQELKDFAEDHTMTTLSSYEVKAGSVVHLMVLLYAISPHLNKVVFDLDWGFPEDVEIDALDASALIFSGNSCVECADFRNKSQAGDAIKHTGDNFDRENKRGRHAITVTMHSIPNDVTHVFFTLSAWNSPNISHFKTPRLRFYEAYDADRMLCEDEIEKAGHRQAIVMCALYKRNGQWFVDANGKLSDGNAQDYGPLIATVREIIATMPE